MTITFTPHISDGRQALLDAARSHIGKHEEGGANRGGFVDEVNQQAGGHKGDAWCASFMSRVIRDAQPGMTSSSDNINVFQFRDEARKNGASHSFGKDGYEPKPGDMIVIANKGCTKGHITMVESYNKETGELVCIGGNVNDAVGRETLNLKSGGYNSHEKGDMAITDIIETPRLPGFDPERSGRGNSRIVAPEHGRYEGGASFGGGSKPPHEGAARFGGAPRVVEGRSSFGGGNHPPHEGAARFGGSSGHDISLGDLLRDAAGKALGEISKETQDIARKIGGVLIRLGGSQPCEVESKADLPVVNQRPLNQGSSISGPERR